MTKTKLLYWIPTILIFLFEGVMPALTGNTEMAKEGIRHLGYPDYFGPMLNGFKIIGAIALVLPMVKGRYKEWVYAGFGIDFLCATISLLVVDGFSGLALFPLIVFGILIMSYVYYHKMNGAV